MRFREKAIWGVQDLPHCSAGGSHAETVSWLTRCRPRSSWTITSWRKKNLSRETNWLSFWSAGVGWDRWGLNDYSVACFHVCHKHKSYFTPLVLWKSFSPLDQCKNIIKMKFSSRLFHMSNDPYIKNHWPEVKSFIIQPKMNFLFVDTAFKIKAIG